jgi:hypothetical protein
VLGTANNFKTLTGSLSSYRSPTKPPSQPKTGCPSPEAFLHICIPGEGAWLVVVRSGSHWFAVVRHGPQRLPYMQFNRLQSPDWPITPRLRNSAPSALHALLGDRNQAAFRKHQSGAGNRHTLAMLCGDPLLRLPPLIGRAAARPVTQFLLAARPLVFWCA